MSTASYVESVRPQLADRDEKIGRVIGILARIVRNYATFDDTQIGSPMVTPSAPWNQDRPKERSRLALLGDEGLEINQEDVAFVAEAKEHAVFSAGFELSEGARTITAMTIEVDPPNVKGFDGIPLATDQIDGAITDLHRYENALLLAERPRE